MPRETISKIDAVRRALAELGKKAKPGQIQQYVKEKFGVEMSVFYVKNCKFKLKKKRRKKAAEPALAPTAAPVKAASAPADGGSVSMGDIAAVKELVGRVGEDGLKSLIGVLA